MDTFKRILDSVDEVDLTPMIERYFSAFDLFYGHHHAQATGSRTFDPIARETSEQ